MNNNIGFVGDRHLELINKTATEVLSLVGTFRGAKLLNQQNSLRYWPRSDNRNSIEAKEPPPASSLPLLVARFFTLRILSLFSINVSNESMLPTPFSLMDR